MPLVGRSNHKTDPIEAPMVEIISPEGIRGFIHDFSVLEDMRAKSIPPEYFGGYCDVCARPINLDKGYWHTDCYGLRKGVRSNLDIRRAQFQRKAKKLRKQVAERDGAFCKVCGGWEGLTLDHIIPMSKGGSDDLDNLQILCAVCNSRKGAR